MGFVDSRVPPKETAWRRDATCDLQPFFLFRKILISNHLSLVDSSALPEDFFAAEDENGDAERSECEENDGKNKYWQCPAHLFSHLCSFFNSNELGVKSCRSVIFINFINYQTISYSFQITIAAHCEVDTIPSRNPFQIRWGRNTFKMLSDSISLPTRIHA